MVANLYLKPPNVQDTSDSSLFWGQNSKRVNFASDNTQNVLSALPTMTASLGSVGGANASQPEAKTVHRAFSKTAKIWEMAKRFLQRSTGPSPCSG